MYQFLRVEGKKLNDWHHIGHNKEKSPKFTFPKNWCLGKIVNGTCTEPAGIAALSYRVNPLVKMGVCVRATNGGS